MLQELRVRNLALIDGLHLDLSTHKTGLIVLTGETGAGKSIILQAINLLAGSRGAASWVRSDCERAEIEAVFALRPDHAELHTLLTEHSLKNEGGCIVRRVLGKDGRSRIYVNDQSITGRLSAELAAGLINIASQHDQQQLLNSRYHLEFLDAFGELHGLRQQFSRLFQRWQQASSELRQLQEKEQDKEQQRDFLRFQLDEIRKAKPVAGEDESLARERELLKSADALHRLIGASSRGLASMRGGDLVDIKKQLDQATGLDPGLGPLAERLASAGYELADLAESLQKYQQNLVADPLRLEVISERLAELKQLGRKYGPSLAEVLAFAERAEATLTLLESLEQEIAQMELRVEEVATEALVKAVELSQARREAALRLTRNMERELATLGFSQVVFRVTMTEAEGMGMVGMHATGRDVVEFLFSANPGEPPKPLASIVSGGELSRLMLAMKCLLARRDQVDTVIFDEVDAGLGGQAAEAVAAKIVELAGHHQVLCITHLPQIAACADLHFKVEKRVEAGRTRTVINPLAREERIAELARMLGGDHPTPRTLAFAGELIERKGGKAAV
ncbi:MAG: DNA repair protein RecN [Proteobacteria bacterium]|nr:DNA repair protein RecN [Pseudomonadota bacterium]